jgi:voltage-gated potassium channel
MNMDNPLKWYSGKGNVQGRYTALLISIVCYLFISPFLQDFPGLRSLVNIFLTGILISGIYSVIREKRVALVAACLAGPMFISIWIYQFTDIVIFAIVSACFGVLFLSFLAVLILKSVIFAKEVSSDVISGAIVVYLFIGVIWGFIFSLIEIMQPGSFSVSVENFRQGESVFVYFSFVTLTTLGYGDILPISAPARSFAYLEALIGQIYLTVLVAALVGLHISQSLEKRK